MLAIGDRVRVSDACAVPDRFPGAWVIVAVHGLEATITPAVASLRDPVRLARVNIYRLDLEPPF